MTGVQTCALPIWAKKKNIPLVFTWHTLYDRYAHFAPIVSEKFAAWWSIRNAVKYANRANQVIVPTESVKKIIENWGVANANIEAVLTGVEEEIFQNSDREMMRKRLGIVEGEIALLLLSRLTAEKNVRFLVESVIEILKKNKKIKFILAGDGSELQILKKMISVENLFGQVIFQGVVKNEIKKNIFAAADIFVYASISETQGMIISEAMFSGLPVVAVEATGIRDMVRDGETGILTAENGKDFQEAIQKLIDDDNLRKTFSQKAGEIARENYTSRICAQKMLEVYEQNIKGNKIVI